MSPSHDYVEDSVCFADLPFHMLGQFQQSFYPTLRSPISDVPKVGLYLIYVAKCLSYFTPDGVPYIFCLHYRNKPSQHKFCPTGKNGVPYIISLH